MTEFEIYLSALFKFLAASLLVERVLELFDQLYSFFGITGGNKKALIRLTGKRLSESGEKKRKLLKMFIMQTVAFVAGILICYYSGLGVAKEFQLISAKTLQWWDVFLAGVFISGGSEPIHQLINFLKSHKDNLKEQRQELEKKQEVSDVAEAEDGFPAIGISYNGGLYPNIPGHGLRKVDPYYIVLHHSMTGENASFEQVVAAEKKERQNAQGSYTLDPSFHCVITRDGKYHNYCRWDSVGWHVARGPRISNSNSLGLCLVGNFHKTKVKPSEEQIESAARVLALWRILYDIDEAHVVQHRTVKARHTVCPGNNFPFDRLVALSTKIQKQWQGDKKIKKEIERFKRLDYVYV